jgi:hypothetical protein
MLPFGVTIPATVLQRSEIPEGLMNYPLFLSLLFSHHFVIYHHRDSYLSSLTDLFTGSAAACYRILTELMYVGFANHRVIILL